MIYEAAVLTPAPVTGAAYAAFRPSATATDPKPAIREIWIANTAATASPIGLIRASNTPVATTSTLGQAIEPADPAAKSNIDTAWSTAPTVGAVYLRRHYLPATAGAFVTWTWPIGKELRVAINTSLVFWNFSGSTAAALYIGVVWEE